MFDEDIRAFSFNSKILMFSSSILLELHINLCSSADLFFILDGRLNNLRSLYVKIGLFLLPSSDIDMKVNLNFILKQLNDYLSRKRSQI